MDEDLARGGVHDVVEGRAAQDAVRKLGDDLVAAKRKGKTAKVDVHVLTDLNGTVLPKVKVLGKALSGVSQKDGIATFAADAKTFVKGSNMVEIVAPEDMTLYDFSVRVMYAPLR